MQRVLGPSGGHKAGKLEGAKGSYLPCAHLILSWWLEHLTLSDPQRLTQSQACQASGVGDGWTDGWITVDSLSHTLSLPWPKFPRRFGDTRFLGLFFFDNLIWVLYKTSGFQVVE